jgi:hypothetical protein
MQYVIRLNVGWYNIQHVAQRLSQLSGDAAYSEALVPLAPDSWLLLYYSVPHRQHLVSQREEELKPSGRYGSGRPML